MQDTRSPLPGLRRGRPCGAKAPRGESRRAAPRAVSMALPEGRPARDPGPSNEGGRSLPALQNTARRWTEVIALCFAPDFCTEKPLYFQPGDFRAKFLNFAQPRLEKVTL